MAVLPYDVPVLFGAVLAVLGTTLATLGGNPFTRWILGVADGGRTAEGPRGGILVELMADSAAATPPRQEEILRGGTTIGYLERASVTLGILAGFPGVVAVDDDYAARRATTNLGLPARSGCSTTSVKPP